MMAEKVTTVVLTSQKDWDEWVEIIKSIAIASNIWNLIDPNTANPLTLEEPPAPKPTNVNSAKTIFSTLDEDEKEELRELRREHKRELNLYDRQKQALNTLRIQIQQTVSRANLSYTFNCETVHDMLVKLQKRFNPTSEAREREVIQRYQKLRVPPRDRAIEPWLQEWERAYNDCSRLKLPDIDGNRAVRDFIYTVDKLEPGFTSYWRNRFLENPKEDFDLYEIIQRFRDYQIETPARFRADYSSFQATYQGKSSDDEKKQQRECLCGQIHHFKDCPYLIKEKRTHEWHPNREIQDKIDEKLRTNEKLRGIIERLQKEAIDIEIKARANMPRLGSF